MSTDEKTQKLITKAETVATKTATKNATDKLKAEIERVKASDLSKAEQKAAIGHLKNVLAAVKSPIG